VCFVEVGVGVGVGVDDVVDGDVDEGSCS